MRSTSGRRSALAQTLRKLPSALSGRVVVSQDAAVSAMSSSPSVSCASLPISSAMAPIARSLILDAESLTELNTVVRNRIRYYNYNRVRRHSSLGDRPPLAIKQDFYREG